MKTGPLPGSADGPIRDLPARGTGGAADVRFTPIEALVRHIVERHHGFLRAELPSLEAQLAGLFPKARSGGPGAGALERFRRFAHLLDGHLRREELTLFPMLLELDGARGRGEPARARAFGPLRNPIAFMTEDHELCDRLLAEVRARVEADGAALPAQARAVLDRLQALEADLAIHVTLEDRVLFPKAIALEEA